jgi:hypothetical protein
MKVESFVGQVSSYVNARNGADLAPLLDVLFYPKSLRNVLQKTAPSAISGLLSKLPGDWKILVEHHFQACESYAGRFLHDAFQHQRDVISVVVKLSGQTDSWLFPVAHGAARDLWRLARESGSLPLQEETARQLLRVFNVTLNDRSGREDALSRKLGVYHVANLLMRVYFQLNQVNLATNLLKVMSHGQLLAPALYPKAQRTEFAWHCGRYYVLRDEFATAKLHLLQAYRLCHSEAKRNLVLILELLVPVIMQTDRRRPPLSSNNSLLPPYMSEFIRHLSSGNHVGYMRTLDGSRPRLAHLGTMALWHALGCTLLKRNLFRRVLAAFEGTTKLPVAFFDAALCLSLGLSAAEGSGERMRKRTLSTLSSLIHTGNIKAYVSLERSFVVFSAKDPFPVPAFTPNISHSSIISIIN